MNECIFLAIVVIGGAALPGYFVVFALLRARKEAQWQDALWKEHENKSATPPPDEKKRAQLRTEIRDLAGISAETCSVAFRGSVLTFLMFLETGLLWHLTHHEPIPAPMFWLLTAVVGGVLILIGILAAQFSRER